MSRYFRQPVNRVSRRQPPQSFSPKNIPLIPTTPDNKLRNWLDQAQYNKMTIIVSIMGLLIALGSSYSSYKQSLAADIQAATAQEQTIAAKEQALAAKDQAVAAKDQTMAAKQQAIASDDQAISAKQQAVASNVQAYESQHQSNLSQNQYNASLPNLNLSVGTAKHQSFIIPIEKQTDALLERGHKTPYRVVVELDVSNLSSMPISVTDMYITLADYKMAFGKSLAKVDKFSVNSTTSLNISNEYPDVFVLQPYEAMRKYAVFAVDYCPTTDVSPATLIINTSRGQFSCPFTVNKMPGIAPNPYASPIRFKFEFNSTNDKNDTPITPHFVPVQ